MKYLMRAVLPTLSVIALVTACNTGTTNASSGSAVTSAEVQSMINASIAPLQQQIATLQGSSAAVFIRAPNAPPVTVAHQLSRKASGSPSTSSCTGLGTLTGRPPNSDPIASNDLSGVSCAGYYFTVSGAQSASTDGYIQPLNAGIAIWYDGPNCTGNSYVALSSGSWYSSWGIGTGAVSNGAVFTIVPPGTSNNPTNTSLYWMLPAQEAPTSPLLVSAFVNGQCVQQGGTFPVYQLQQNVPATSGVPSAPIPGPITIA